MSTQPLLSICIPTYNREKNLKETIDSIIYQEGFSQEEIEIVISDNASPDNTQKLIEKYQKHYTNIIYHRNNINIGGDKNILNVLQTGNGKYVRGISDDDIILPGGLQIVKDSILKNINKNIWLFQTNFNSLNKDGSLIKKSFLGDRLETKIYENLDKLYKSYGYSHNGLTFFSINIFNSKIRNLKLDRIPFTRFSHSCIMGLISDKKAMFIADNIIGYRTNNNSVDFHSIRFFFTVFVVGHIKYMNFLKKNKSLVSQKQLTIILIKMIIYSFYLRSKSICYKGYTLIQKFHILPSK